MDLNWTGASLHLRDSWLEGLSGMVSSAFVIGALLQIGLPVMFLVALSFFRSALGLAPFSSRDCESCGPIAAHSQAGARKENAGGFPPAFTSKRTIALAFD